ncbi:MAG: hypothetical protein Q4A72_00825 [Bacillota bacterium]|nr:hypothetical protein [Bacillota bacterium]
MKKEINRYLAPLRLKMSLEKLLQLLAIYVLFAGSLTLLVLLYTKVLPLPGYFTLIKRILQAGGLLFLLHFAWSAPRLGIVLKTADRLYFKERLLTAIEFEGLDGEALELQREDTRKSMRAAKVEELYKIRFDKRLLFAILLLAGLLFGSTFLETEEGMKNRIASQNIEEVKEETESLKKALKKVLEDSGLSEDRSAELIKQLEENLKGIEAKEDALKALAITKNEFQESLSEEELKQLEGALKKIDESARKLAGNSLSDYAFNGEEGAGEQGAGEPQNPQDEGSESDGEEQDSDSGTNAGESSSNGGEQGGTASDGSGQSQGGQGGSQSGGQGSPGSGSNPQSGGANPDGSQNQGTNPNQGDSANQGGAQNQSGSGAGALNGNGGKNRENANQAGKGGKGAAIGAAGSNEIMLDPKRIGTGGNNEFVPGQKSGENEDSTYRRAKTRPKDAGEIKDYKKIFAEYAKEAGYTGKELNIPNGMRDVVKSYFDSIQR